MTLPSRYDGNGVREHVHLRLMPDMYWKLANIAHPKKSVPDLIREILTEWLEGYPQISSGSPRDIDESELE